VYIHAPCNQRGPGLAVPVATSLHPRPREFNSMKTMIDILYVYKVKGGTNSPTLLITFTLLAYLNFTPFCALVIYSTMKTMIGLHLYFFDMSN
jgi:hypothetical protein